MSTPLPVAPSDFQLDPRTYARGLACVHCGLCLPACPTYTTTFHEADSPRGRIQLMLGLHEGTIPLTDGTREHLDLCLDCRACETACPSGVVYHELIEETRAKFADRSDARPPLFDRLLTGLFRHVFTQPFRLKLMVLPARVLQKLRLHGPLTRSPLMRLLPAKLAKMARLLPTEGALWPRRLPERLAGDKPSTRVAFFEGCVGSVMYDKVNRMAAELLAAAGAEVISPRSQKCCGAIHHHGGDEHAAIELAKKNIDAFFALDPQPQFIANTAAGCGAMLREYDFLLKNEPDYVEKAKAFVTKVRDISEVVLAVGLPPLKHDLSIDATYHDACHLAHAQRVTAAPRQLLAKIGGLKLTPLPESDMCCGAAGTYNLSHPEMAESLGARKLNNIALARAGVCVSGNVGCTMHLAGEAAARNQQVTFLHPVELLHRAAFGPVEVNSPGNPAPA